MRKAARHLDVSQYSVRCIIFFLPTKHAVVVQCMHGEYGTEADDTYIVARALPRYWSVSLRRVARDWLIVKWHHQNTQQFSGSYSKYSKATDNWNCATYSFIVNTHWQRKKRDIIFFNKKCFLKNDFIKRWWQGVAWWGGHLSFAIRTRL